MTRSRQESIKQNADGKDGAGWGGGALPDLRSAGLTLRVIAIAHAVALAHFLLLAPPRGGRWNALLGMAARLEFPLLLALALLWLLAPSLGRLAPLAGRVAVVCIAALAAALAAALSASAAPAVLRDALLAALFAGAMLHYFDLRGRSLSPAVMEARLAALTARIRPHFLFNSLNAVLSLIRSEPRRAEQALEELADLFRAAMSDLRELRPLSQEIALARQYLALEKLRLGDRLEVVWQIEAMPEDVRVPPLILQPLLENAVYHGVEPRAAGGCVTVALLREGDRARIEVRNPRAESLHRGNGLALANIRERLRLHFDMGAGLDVAETENEYVVRLMLPWHGAKGKDNGKAHAESSDRR